MYFSLMETSGGNWLHWKKEKIFPSKLNVFTICMILRRA